ncbi:MAG: FAD-binding oxidoreductase [Leptolyngbyaceae cyanobacterium SM2_5_2]|nr:FAD-binding oxidoreductase [Leptolyngbyaceae cyanobacterium SM2_5_2]
MTRVVIVGCGVVGAAIAYELSLCPEFEVVVVDRQPPASGSSGAALGVAMGVISHKVQGRNWQLREQSLLRYPALIAELEAITGQQIQHNTQGILSLCFVAEELPRWRSLQAIRQQQGHTLDIWPPEQVAHHCPHLNLTNTVAGIYSPQDLQVNPTQLTQALVAAATLRGVRFHLGKPVVAFKIATDSAAPYCRAVLTSSQSFEADWVVLAAGLGTTALTENLGQATVLGPVLGQGLKLHLAQNLGNPDFQPVINGNDIHLVPLGAGDYWVGATVEFPTVSTPADGFALQPEAALLEAVWQGALAYCPALAQGTIIDRWFGLRPRPQAQAAPVIKPLEGYRNIWLATGHYRNGVLLAPATALTIRDHLLNG